MGKTLEAVKEIFTRRPTKITVEEYLLKLKEKGLSIDGKEISDPVPIAPPIGYKKQPTMVELIRDMVRGENLRRLAEEEGAETLEEADDFEVGDDPELLKSGYENDLDPPLSEILTAGRQELDRKSQEPPAPPPQPPGSEAVPTPPPGPSDPK